jgi:hypothetical protein
MRQEPVGASFICRHPGHAPPNEAGPSETADWHIGRSLVQSSWTAGRKRPVAPTIDCPPPAHENATADLAGAAVAVVAVSVARWVPNWKQVLQIIKPDTLLRWQREGFRLFWKLKSGSPVQT